MNIPFDKNKYKFGMNNGIGATPKKSISISDINIHKMEHNMNTIKKRAP